MKTRTRTGKAFTLIEMLVVIVIIGILMGIILRLASLVHDKVGRAKATARLEQLKNCLEEYYRVYGIYPPAVFMGYESPSEVDHKKPPDWDSIVSGIKEGGGRVPRKNLWPCTTLGTTGLVYFLMADGASFRNSEADRWQEYFGKSGCHMYGVAHQDNDSWQWGFEYGHFDFTNMGYTFWDSWDKDYVYVPRDPTFRSYQVWSAGPDRLTELDAWLQSSSPPVKVDPALVYREWKMGILTLQQAIAKANVNEGQFSSLTEAYILDDVGFDQWTE